jgi:YCII-related domain-containing protein
MAEQMHFFCRLIPPRADFMTSMTEAERGIMRQHVGYWSGKVATGNALLFGPVADPKAGYGIGVMRAAGWDEMNALRDADPAMQADVGFAYEIFVMPQVVMKP